MKEEQNGGVAYPMFRRRVGRQLHREHKVRAVTCGRKHACREASASLYKEKRAGHLGTFAGENLVARAIVNPGLGFDAIFLAFEPYGGHWSEQFFRFRINKGVRVCTLSTTSPARA